jgi:hypothetical protein
MVTIGWSDWDWGNVPAWVGTIVTRSSFLIAALSYRRSVRDKEGEQASRVAAWHQMSGEQGLSRRVLHISNGSDGPIYDVVARVESDPALSSYRNSSHEPHEHGYEERNPRHAALCSAHRTAG